MTQLETAQLLELTNLTFTLAILIYASYSDYKTREVTNIAWMIYAPIAATITCIRYLFFEQFLPWYLPLLSIAITWLFAIVLFYAGAFGGADAKALMCIALAHPLYPASVLQPLYETPVIFFPISVFSNAIIIAVLSVLYMVIRNFAWKKRTNKKLFEGLEEEGSMRKFLTLLTGYKVSLDDLKTKTHFYPLEDVDIMETDSEDAKRKLVLFPKDEAREKMILRLEEAVNKRKIQDSFVWATPGLPMLIFVTVGLLLTLFLGDILWIALRFLLPI